MGDIVHFDARRPAHPGNSRMILEILRTPAPEDLLENHSTGEFHCGPESFAKLEALLRCIGHDIHCFRTVQELYGILLFATNVSRDAALFIEKPGLFSALHGSSDWGRYIRAVCDGETNLAGSFLHKFLRSGGPGAAARSR